MLRSVYPQGGIVGCMPLLPGRSRNAVGRRASQLDLKMAPEALHAQRQACARAGRAAQCARIAAVAKAVTQVPAVGLPPPAGHRQTLARSPSPARDGLAGYGAMRMEISRYRDLWLHMLVDPRVKEDQRVRLRASADRLGDVLAALTLLNRILKTGRIAVDAPEEVSA